VICPERRRLLEDYRDAAVAYSEAVRNLVDTICGEFNADMDLLRGACKRTWDASEQTRLALHRHEANHFCDRKEFTLKTR
jgi:hypothetical protein